MAANRREFLLGAATVVAGAALPTLASAAVLRSSESSAETAGGESAFLVERKGGALTSLRFAGDAFPTNYVGTGQELGHVLVVWRRNGGAWQKFDSSDVPEADAKVTPADAGFEAEYRAKDEHGEAVAITVRMEPQASIMRWSRSAAQPRRRSGGGGRSRAAVAHALQLRRQGAADGVGVEASLRLRTRIVPVLAAVQQRWAVPGDDARARHAPGILGPHSPRPAAAERHRSVPGQTQAQATATVAPIPQRPAFRAYVHSAAAGETVAAAGGRWRQPRTSVTLAPAAAAASTPSNWRGRKTIQRCGIGWSRRA